MAGFNKTALAAAEALQSAELAISNAAIRKETEYWTELLDDMAEHLNEFQESVENERGLWNMIAGGAGCIIGGILGFEAGGPQGGVQGCKTGSKVTTIASDYVYDSDKWDTPKEKRLKEYTSEFKELEIDLSQVAKRFLAQGGYEREKQLEGFHDDYWTDFETWEEGFYGKEGYDYGMEFLASAIDFGTSEGGQAIAKGFQESFGQDELGPAPGSPGTPVDMETDFDDIDPMDDPEFAAPPADDPDVFYQPYKSAYVPGFSPQQVLDPQAWQTNAFLPAEEDIYSLDDWYRELSIIDASSVYDEWNLGDYS